MRKTIFAILFVFLPVIAFSQTAQEIVDKCVKKIGGKEAIQKYLDYQATGTVTYFRRGSEMKGGLKVIYKQHKYWKKIDLDFGGTTFTMKSVFDGENAFSERNGRISDQPALNSFSDMAHTIEVLINEKSLFHVNGEKEIEGAGTIGIEATLDGKQTLFFIDAETFEVREISFKDMYFGDNNTKELQEKQILLNDYKTVDGVRIPMQTTFVQKGKKQFVYSYDTVEFAPQVDGAIFIRPKEEMDLRYWEETIH